MNKKASSEQWLKRQVGLCAPPAFSRDRCAPPGKNKLKSTDERIGEIYRKYISVFGRMENEILLGGIGRQLKFGFHARRMNKET